MNRWSGEANLQLELDLYNDYVKAEPDPELSPEAADVSPLNWDNENFSWEALNTDLFGGTLPASVEGIDDQCALSDIPSPGEPSEASTASNCHAVLMAKYNITDDQLGDMTLKKLKKRCSDEQDFTQLKSYRRTCLNRGYARASRNKQQQKASGLSARLQFANEEVKRLSKELEEKDMRIQYLELENRLLMGFNKPN